MYLPNACMHAHECTFTHNTGRKNAGGIGENQVRSNDRARDREGETKSVYFESENERQYN
jgi:hypothetical protein